MCSCSNLMVSTVYSDVTPYCTTATRVPDSTAVQQYAVHGMINGHTYLRLGAPIRDPDSAL